MIELSDLRATKQGKICGINDKCESLIDYCHTRLFTVNRYRISIAIQLYATLNTECLRYSTQPSNYINEMNLSNKNTEKSSRSRLILSLVNYSLRWNLSIIAPTYRQPIAFYNSIFTFSSRLERNSHTFLKFLCSAVGTTQWQASDMLFIGVWNS